MNAMPRYADYEEQLAAIAADGPRSSPISSGSGKEHRPIYWRTWWPASVPCLRLRP
ncbi:MAG: hypothetical protein NZP34_15405 [Caldilineales bacterium]|nr:hypothetical protein [Caldilineales bacterium]